MMEHFCYSPPISERVDTNALNAQMVEKQFDRRIKVIGIDNAEDFINCEFQTFCAQSVIMHETSCAYNRMVLQKE